VDDHPVVRQGVASLINMEPDLIVCAEAENADQALRILKEETVHLAIIDISLDGTNGTHLTEIIKAKYPNMPVLILTIHDEAYYGKRIQEAGAKGYVNKREGAETIIAAIRLVLSGKQYFMHQSA
jgi:DNA-binding NarL/FixJ family response regulator